MDMPLSSKGPPHKDVLSGLTFLVAVDGGGRWRTRTVEAELVHTALSWCLLPLRVK